MASSSNSPNSLHHSPFGPLVTEKLTRDNFVLWKAQFLPGVRGAHAMGILDGTSPEPAKTITIEKDGKSEETPNPAHEAWVTKDQQLLGHLLNSVTKEVLGQVVTLSTSAEVWAALQTSFAASSHARVTNLRLQLANIKKGDVKMHEFIQEVEYSISLGACDRLDLDPLCELVDGHQYFVESTWSSWQWTNHVEPPTGERPGWRYGD
jgi:hypothetical protein